MTITVQQAFETIAIAAKEKAVSIFAKSEGILTAIAGWLIMLVGTPYLALNMPQVSGPVTFVCSIFTIGVFFVGAMMIQKGLGEAEGEKVSLTKH